MSDTHFNYEVLRDFAAALGEKAGLPVDRARVQAEILLEGDLMGHTTHGLALLPGLLGALESGDMRARGEPKVLSDRGSVILWDAERLPGTWLLTHAISQALSRIRQHPVMTIVIRQLTHIAALGAYLRQATDHGLLIWIMNSDPSMRTVAPAGGRQGQLSPNPLAFGYPTNRDPVLIDISTSSVANGWVRRWNVEKKKLPGKWLLDGEGNPTDDPAALFGPPTGAMLPLGGLELGHKGFGLALIVEVLTSGLSGLGRADEVTPGTGAPVFLQLIDPSAFAGVDALKRETGWLADVCRATASRVRDSKVRMPGDAALALRRDQLQDGVSLYPTIMPDLSRWAAKLGVTVPQPAART
jgi:LDH2 family malate/lactate/ureidoglycolate dehydrogenase